MAIGSLRSGGAERVLSLLARAFTERGHSVSIITLASTDSDFFDAGLGVTRIGLAVERDAHWTPRRIWGNAWRVLRLRRALADVRPDAIVSFMTSMNVLICIATVGLRATVVISERVDPSRHDPGRMWSWLRKLVYFKADALVLQTSATEWWFRDAMPRLPEIAVIANPVDSAEPRRTWAPSKSDPYILTVGRLEWQKGHDVLIRAFAECLKRFPGLQLQIVGRGSQEDSLRALCHSLGVEDRVRFLGEVRDVSRYLSGASGFILASRYEGFPNGLLEALAAGVPVIAADCPTGPREILGDNAAGLLVPVEDVHALSDAMSRLLSEPELARRLAAAGPEVTRQRYSLAAIADQWLAVLRQGTKA